MRRLEQIQATPTRLTTMIKKVVKTEEEWKASLTSEQYDVLRGCGTEAPFSGEYYYNKENGMYLCGACGNELFSSEAKYESGSGWPSFSATVNKENTLQHMDDSHGMVRTEIRCNRCGGHLGHVFDDGPTPTGKRYCINSSALKFKKVDGK